MSPGSGIHFNISVFVLVPAPRFNVMHDCAAADTFFAEPRISVEHGMDVACHGELARSSQALNRK